MIREEEKFMVRHTEAAKWIILTPYALAELNDKYSDDFEELYSYMGLRIAVSGHPMLVEFELA